MSGELELLKNYAVSKRRVGVQLSVLEDLTALARRASKALPETAAILTERVEVLEKKLTAEITTLYAQIDQAEILISQLENPLWREVLERHYMQLEDFAEIAAAMHYSERHVRRMHRAALEKLTGSAL
ncbi:MAG: hypothetical protein J6I98_01970 [Clostridia bacterium]|nr:hypothetical protein [Clostridia bacterium]